MTADTREKMAADTQPEGVAALRRLLAASWPRVRDVFAAWDEDNSGSIDREEFSMALNGLRLSVSHEEACDLFVALDVDGGGTLDYTELHRALRPGGEIELAEELHDGACAITVGARNKHALRTDGPQTSRSRWLLMPLALGAGSTTVERLRNALTGSWTRVQDLFREWDADGGGTVDRNELYRALALLGLRASREEVNELFSALDSNGDGELSFEELRRQVSPHGLEPALFPMELTLPAPRAPSLRMCCR
jgi:Ca2+-binding EF-hand superfamily protein